jgi:hypothetical protein
MSAFNFNNRRFHMRDRNNPGQFTGTIFYYNQTDDVVWGHYVGGGCKYGQFMATVDDKGVLNLRFQHMTDDGEWQWGNSLSTPSFLPDGRIMITEDFLMESNNLKAISVVEELL